MSVEEVNIVDGIEGGHVVLKRETSNGRKWIELYDEDGGTKYGTLPANTSAASINTVLDMIGSAYRRGLQDGKLKKQHELCEALGVHALMRDVKEEIKG